MEMNSYHSIAGGWLGTYVYDVRFKTMKPARFEATFTVNGGSDTAFSGTILDDNYLGEAQVDGVQTGGLVKFTKTYLTSKASRGKHSVEYVGTMSEDGRRIAGTWKIAIWLGVTSGSWEAQRRWAEDAEEEVREEQDIIAISREIDSPFEVSRH
jgi:hypothetical protein